MDVFSLVVAPDTITILYVMSNILFTICIFQKEGAQIVFTVVGSLLVITDQFY